MCNTAIHYGIEALLYIFRVPIACILYVFCALNRRHVSIWSMHIQLDMFYRQDTNGLCQSTLFLLFFCA